MGGVHPQAESLIVGPDYRSVLVEPAGAEAPVALFISSVRAEVIVLHNGIAENHILPVGVDRGVVEVRRIIRGFTYKIVPYPGVYAFALKQGELRGIA